MTFVRVHGRPISLEVTKFFRPHRVVFDQTDVSGADVFAAYSFNNFSNPFQRTDKERYRLCGSWDEIFRDIVRKSGKGTSNGRLNVQYVSHAGAPMERTHNDIWAPDSGYWVPTDDGIFYPETLIPFETVKDRGEAIKCLEARGIPKEQVSRFSGLSIYDEDRFVSRGYSDLESGRFYVDAESFPNSRRNMVGSRPAIECIFEIP